MPKRICHSLATDDILETQQDTLVVLSPLNGKPRRRILFVNSYGGRSDWEKIKKGLLPPHHLWGCIELARMGYEVGIAEPLPAEFYLCRNPFPHDLALLRTVRGWLGPEDIIYCGHNVLYWLPFLKQLGMLRCVIVSLLFAREPLDLARAHAGIIALNPVAAEHGRKLAPRAKVAHLSWGADLSFFPNARYQSDWLLSCGITYRDHKTLSAAASRCGRRVRVICPERPLDVNWPTNVEVVESGRGWNTEQKNVSYQDLLHCHYAGAAGSLIITGRDDEQRGACGFTNLIEAMAMGRPVILTRTGALVSEIDVEKEGCGLHVPPGNPEALAEAMEAIFEEPDRAEAMGRAGRKLCESRYNIQRYAKELHEFFESL
jgi:hypothetical protein